MQDTLSFPLATAIALASLFSCAATAAGAAAADPQALLAGAKEAAGGNAWDRVRTLHSIIQVETGGLKGRLDSWSDVMKGRFAERYQLGPATGANGFDGKTAWEQDSSGQVRIQDSADSRQATTNEVYRRSVAYWFPGRGQAKLESGGEKSEEGRRFQILRVTPQGGRLFEVWIDAATLLFDRIVEKGAIETRTTFLADYRTVDGLVLPFAMRSSNGNARYDQTFRVEKVEVNSSMPEAAFAMPAPPPPDFAMAGGKTSTAVPFELINGHIYLDVKLNGRGPYRLLCDTGGANVITPPVARELGVKPEGTLEGRGVGQKSEDVSLVKLESLQIGDATIERQLFVVFDLGKLEPAEGAPIPGLVGYEVFKRFVVRIDYGRRLLTLTLPSAFGGESHGVGIPFRFDRRTPQVDGEIDGVAGTFSIDTGSRASLDLLGPFVEKNGLVAKYGAKLQGITGWGVGGPARALITRTRLLKLGPVEVRDVVTTLSLQKQGAFTDVYLAGNIGFGVLRRFTVTFDYGHQRMYLEPSASEIPRDSFDRAGLWLNRGDGFFEVVDVIAGGPAEEAGVRAGNRVVAVDGVAAAGIALPDLRLRLRTDPPGTRVRLRLLSDGAEREVTVILRDLV